MVPLKVGCQIKLDSVAEGTHFLWSTMKYLSAFSFPFLSFWTPSFVSMVGHLDHGFCSCQGYLFVFFDMNLNNMSSDDGDRFAAKGTRSSFVMLSLRLVLRRTGPRNFWCCFL